MFRVDGGNLNEVARATLKISLAIFAINYCDSCPKALPVSMQRAFTRWKLAFLLVNAKPRRRFLLTRLAALTMHALRHCK